MAVRGVTALPVRQYRKPQSLGAHVVTVCNDTHIVLSRCVKGWDKVNQGYRVCRREGDG